MRSVATDGVAWSVCVSVGHLREPSKTAAPIEMPFWWVTGVDPRHRNHALDGVQIPQGKGQFWAVVRTTEKH